MSAEKERFKLLDLLSGILEDYEFEEMSCASDTALAVFLEFPNLARLFARVRIESKSITGLFGLCLWLEDKEVLCSFPTSGWVNFYTKNERRERQIEGRAHCIGPRLNLDNPPHYRCRCWGERHAKLTEEGWRWYRSFREKGYEALSKMIGDPLVSDKIERAFAADVDSERTGRVK